MSVLQLDQVSYQYEGAGKKALSNISLSFEAGTLTAIMGRSGSGKTTLLSLLSGLELPTGGKILYQGTDLKELDRDDYRARRIGVIFQSYNLLTNATVLENILLSMEIGEAPIKDKKKAALDLLQKVGIDPEKAGRKTLRLSGGEQQRVGIARALANSPDVILADEPTGNLDGETESGIMEIFKAMAQKQKKCVIVVTHSKQVASYADRVVQLHAINGKGESQCSR